SLILASQVALFYSASREDAALKSRPLSGFSTGLGDWRFEREIPLEPEVVEVLRADDTLNRLYSKPGAAAGLFVAWFRTQRHGQAPHSPKNCLPGSGWIPSSSGVLELAVPGEPRPIRINRYLVSRGDERSLVLYWYQTPNRVIASEFAAKFWLVADSIRHRRSDTALVRVVIPLSGIGDREAEELGADLVRRLLPNLRNYLPS
ncbi:MAG: EpsI family protein, partial [Acidobacteria bacterium]|nr:EpsI family protein [Acidobacteriota bacterium]